MDVLLWLGWSVAMLVTVFTVWMLMFGASAARSPHWDVALYQAGLDELAARAFVGPGLSLDGLHLRERLLGTEPGPVDEDTDDRLLVALRALTNATHEDLGRLHELRHEILHDAVSTQRATVARVTAPWVLVKLWHSRRILSTVCAAVRGLVWFTPLFVARARDVGEKYLTTATLLGVWLGFLYWGWRQMVGLGGSTDWPSIVGVVVTVACAIGLAATAGRLMSAVVVAWWGPPSSWTRRGVWLAFACVTTMSLSLVLIMTGMLQRASIAVASWLTTWLEDLALTESAGAVLVLAGIIYMARNAVALVRSKVLRVTDRISTGATALFLLALGLLMVVFILDAGPPWRTLSVYTSGALVFVAGVAVTVVTAVEWVNDYRYVRSEGVVVPRRGFRLWALSTWIIAGVVVWISSVAMDARGAAVSSSPVDQSMSIVLVLVQLVLTLAFLPGTAVTVLYVRRVSRSAAARRHQRQTPDDEQRVRDLAL